MIHHYAHYPHKTLIDAVAFIAIVAYSFIKNKLFKKNKHKKLVAASTSAVESDKAANLTPSNADTTESSGTLTREEMDNLLKNRAEGKAISTSTQGKKRIISINSGGIAAFILRNLMSNKNINRSNTTIKTGTIDNPTNQEKAWLAQISPDIIKKVPHSADSESTTVDLTDASPTAHEPTPVKTADIHSVSTVKTSSNNDIVIGDSKRKKKSMIEV